MNIITTTPKIAQFNFKKITPNDLPLLYSWFKQPQVEQWWPVPTQEEFFEKFLLRIRSKDTFPFLVLADGIPFAYIQYYYIDRTQPKAGKWLPELPETTVGTDQFIGDPAFLAKGYGAAFIKAFIDYLATIEPHITTVIVDPDPTNIIAIRCYEKNGFKKVGNYTTEYGQIVLMRYDRKITLPLTTR